MDATKFISAVGIILASMLLPGCVSVNCTAKPTHTRCLNDVGTEITMTTALKAQIVQKHNDERALITNAANMQKLVWDDELAITASKWAKQCKPGHDDDEDRVEDSLPGVAVGQNAHGGTGSLGGMIIGVQKWISEKVNFTHGQPTDNVVGHYTQVVLAESARIGCGMANCTGHYKYTQINVCNYAPGMNNYTHPYKKGTSCSACTDNCEDGKLCDCGGKVCKYGGTLNLQTCTCNCVGAFTGDTCQTCPTSDASVCDYWFAPERNWESEAYPCIFTNVKADCPVGCKVC